MSIRRKTLIVVTLILIGLIIIVYEISDNMLLNSYSNLEEDDARRNIQRAISAFDYDMSILSSLAYKWAISNDSYEFIEDRNDKYIKSNLGNSAFTEFNINAIVFLNSNGKIIYGQGFDLVKKERTTITDSLKTLITEKAFFTDQSQNSRKNGIIMLPEAPALISACPIMTSEGKGPVRGTLIIARYINTEEIKRLAERTNLNLDLIKYEGLKKIKRINQIKGNEVIFLSPINGNLISGYGLIKDIYGNPAFAFKANIPREIYKQGIKSRYYLIITLILAGTVLGGIILILLEEIVLVPLTRLSQNVNNIGLSRKLSERVSIRGGNEFSSLGGSINDMLAALEQSHKDIEMNEKRFRLLAENAQDIIYRMQIYPEKRFEYMSPVVTKITGYTPEEHYEDPDLVLKMTCSEDQNNLKEMFSQEGDFSKPLVLRWITKDKRTIWVEERNVPIYDSNGKLIAIEGIARDISHNKRMEEQLKYFSLHDSLTGLYNRNYYEEEMRRIETGRYKSAAVIVCDLDGLKFVNDTIGHEKGDILLCEVAKIIKKSMRGSDLIARVGGDEFAVILPDISEQMTQNIYKRIMNKIQNFNMKHQETVLSLSVGIALSKGESINMAELFKEADDMMYREKLNQRQSARSAIVETLMKALQARDFITEGHADRLQDLVVKLGEAIGLNEQKLSDLRLFARFHDIGKVGISDCILFKPDSLTTDEYNDMKKHCEIGYKIAQCSPDLTQISDWILKHHEYWNGRGYPIGLKGTDIPLECRMLGIADAYDAMVSDRPYRKGLSKEVAVQRLINAAGEQFDPDLVPKFIELINKRKISKK